MASIPSKFNTALDALVVQLLADISLSVVARTSFAPEKPEDWWDVSSWPTDTQLVLGVVDGVAAEIDPEIVEDFDRYQGAAGEVVGWSVSGDNSTLSTLRVNHVRTIRNTIETVGAANPLDDGWTINWHDAGGRRDVESNRPPYAAFRVPFIVTAWE